MFLLRRSCQSNIIAPLMVIFPPPTPGLNYYFSLVFNSFTMMFLGVDCFYLSHLKFLWEGFLNFGMISFMSFGKVLSHLLKYPFLLLFEMPTTLRSDMLTVSFKSLTLYPLYSVFFLLCNSCSHPSTPSFHLTHSLFSYF